MSDMAQRKVAMVTGSGRRRVGNVVATALAQSGYAMALHYHSSGSAAEESLKGLRDTGVDCEAFQADVGVEAEVEGMFDSVVERFGRLDVLVTTASIWETTSLEDVTSDSLLRNFQINTLGTFLCARRAGLIMADQEDGGSIVTIGDWAIQRPYLGHSAYFVSKGAIPTLTRTLALELAHRNPKVRVNCIHPGPVMFPPDSSPDERQEMIESTLVKTANCPESIAQAVLSLVHNPFVTGVCLPIDGGRTIFAGESTSRKRPI
jgi:pteridine reductase